MKVKFVAGFAPIVTNLGESRKFYGELLSVPIEFKEGSDYTATDNMDGMKHFGLWTLQGAAQSVFGQDEWPSDVPIPQGTIEFDVDDVAEAVAELKSNGATILQDTKVEPWGQTPARLLSPEGLLIGITYTPWMRE
jgi:uncharacterized glyoxalase superfamily protein PhnB